MHGIDIKEDELLAIGGGILDTLLIDRTTGVGVMGVSWGQVNDIIPMRYKSYSITVLQFSKTIFLRFK